MMKTSTAGINLIKSFEGFEPKMYLDVAGYPTIGYGTLIDTEEEKYLLNAVITEAKATELLVNNLSKIEEIINKSVKVVLTQNQFDALASFVYNVGSANFLNSTLLRKINAMANIKEIATEFFRWVYTKGKKVQTLVNRRLNEFMLYAGEDKVSLIGILFLLSLLGFVIYKLK